MFISIKRNSLYIPRSNTDGINASWNILLKKKYKCILFFSILFAYFKKKYHQLKILIQFQTAHNILPCEKS